MRREIVIILSDKDIILVDKLYNIMQHIHDRLYPKEQDDDWLVDAIQDAEDISAELASPGEGISKLFFYDLAYHAVNRQLSIDKFYCILKMYKIILV